MFVAKMAKIKYVQLSEMNIKTLQKLLIGKKVTFHFNQGHQKASGKKSKSGKVESVELSANPPHLPHNFILHGLDKQGEKVSVEIEQVEFLNF